MTTVSVGHLADLFGFEVGIADAQDVNDLCFVLVVSRRW
jgi:hypothetical protein